MIGLNYQRNDKWYYERMTQAIVTVDPLKRSWKDIIGDYGCLVTSISNILKMTIDKDNDPKKLNAIIVEGKGYNYLTNPTCKEEQASFLNWGFIEKTFPVFEYSYNLKDYKDDAKSFYIARVLLHGGGHYINVLRRLSENSFVCFDVWDNTTKIYDRSEITFFHRMKLK